MATTYPTDLTRDELGPNHAARSGRVARILARQLVAALDKPQACPFNDPAVFGAGNPYVNAQEWTALGALAPAPWPLTDAPLDFLCCLRSDVTGSGTATLRLRHGANVSSEVSATAGGAMLGPLRVALDPSCADQAVGVEAKTSAAATHVMAWQTRTDLWSWWEDR